MELKRKLRIFNNGKSRNPKPTTFFFSASLLPPPKKPKLLHSHRIFEPRRRTSWFSQTGPPFPPLLPTPHLLSPLPPLLPTPPHLGDRRRLGAPYSLSILGEVPHKLRQLAIRKKHRDIFNADKSKNNHTSGKAQFLQATTANARHHVPASVSRPVIGGIQRMHTTSPARLPGKEVEVGSHSNTKENVYSQTTPAEKRFVYNKQDLLVCRFHYPQSQEILLVCERLHIILGGASPKELVHKKRYRSKDQGAHSGNAKRFRLAPKEIRGHLCTFSAHSLQVALKINHGKRKFTFEEKGQPFKRRKSERPGRVVKKNSSLKDKLAIPVQEIGQKKRQRTAKGGSPFSHFKRQKSAPPGAELLSSVFALTFLYIFSLWRLLLYNSRHGRGGLSALSRYAPSPSGSSEVVPQQPSSHP